MSDAPLSRPLLCQRAEVLGRMADQLARQLEVERQANEELRELLGDTSQPPMARARRRARALPFVFAAAGGILLVTSVSALVLRARAAPFAVPYAAALPQPPGPPLPAPAMLHSLSVSPPESPLVPQTPAWPIRIKDREDRKTGAAVGIEEIFRHSEGSDARPSGDQLGRLRACLPITSSARARCYLDATQGAVSGELGMRNLIIAYEILGHRELARVLARQYLERYPDSRFHRQVSRLAR